MYFTTHLLVGAAAGGTVAAAGGPVWASFLAGLGTHAALDMVPHHDYHRACWALLDIAFGLALGALAFALSPQSARVWGGLGGVLPDLEVVAGHLAVGWGLSWRSFFPSHSGRLPHPHWSYPLGMLSQVILAGVGFWFLTR